ncbi:MAG: hypothetical protein XXXJIFNMEKO3_01228 [Candidatus Erwinia impunctatus]|nr:hypothetical protein XXXJIFNMEKO_01228 [Culicoides impunctatus]
MNQSGCSTNSQVVWPKLVDHYTLTGYELSHAQALALTAEDTRLKVFCDAAQQYSMTLSVGLPLRIDNDFFLAAMIFFPDGTNQTYAKRALHGEEKRYFSPGKQSGISGQSPRKTAQIICADLNEARFAEEAATHADLYAASVLVSANGYQHDVELLETWSHRYHIPVLMSNHARPSGGLHSAAQSGFWNSQGQCVIRADREECIMIARRSSGKWRGECHTFTESETE